MEGGGVSFKLFLVCSFLGHSFRIWNFFGVRLRFGGEEFFLASHGACNLDYFS